MEIVDQYGTDDNAHRSKGICHNVKVKAKHIVRVTMVVIMRMTAAMRMSMVMMSHGKHAKQIDQKTQSTHNQ